MNIPRLATPGWVADTPRRRIAALARGAGALAAGRVAARIEALAAENHRIHGADCLNLNPATNVMNPRAEALLAAGLGTRPSLGLPGDKYEMGLEAIEEIEVIAAEMAAEVFDADFAEVRVASGALANLYAFMATCKPGDTIIAPPGSVGGHVTHHAAGAAGLYGLRIIPAPVDADGYTIDVAALGALAREERPGLITCGASLNLFPHPVAAIRKIADEVGAKVLFDAAHLCGMIAGRAWENPLDQGAHLMTMSTYKSLGGPAGGLLVTRDATLAERVDAIAHPGLTANFDAGRVAALAVALDDWRACGQDYARAMAEMATALAAALAAEGIAPFATKRGITRSHQFAVAAAAFGGGQAASRRLREANVLACGIGLPIAGVAGDMNGLRIGTPELVRMGMTPEHAPVIASFIARGLTGNDPAAVAGEVAAFRRQFTRIGFTA